MIDVIIAYNGNKNDLCNTLLSLGRKYTYNVILCSDAPDEQLNEIISDMKNFLPNLTLHISEIVGEGTYSKYKSGIDSKFSMSEFITFLNAGDTVCADYLFPKMESILTKNQDVVIVKGDIVTEGNQVCYGGRALAQGKLIKRHFLNFYYNKLNTLTSDVEFALYLSYLGDLEQTSVIKFTENVVNIPFLSPQGLGEGYGLLFTKIIPSLSDKDTATTNNYLYQGLCDFFFGYLGLINLEKEEAAQLLFAEAQIFYGVLGQELLVDPTLLLSVYNMNVLTHYSTFNDPVTLKLPTFNIIDFLNELEKSLH